jgi:hypothetical protein
MWFAKVKVTHAEHALLRDIIDDGGFRAISHKGRPNMCRLLHEKATEIYRGLNVAHRIVRPVVFEPISWCNLIQLKYPLAIVVDGECQRIRGIEAARLNNTHNIRPAISGAICQIWIV